LAPQAIPSTSAGEKDAIKLVSGHTNAMWNQWANESQSAESKRPMPVSPTSPEWVMLTWPTQVKLSGIGAIFAGFADADIQFYADDAEIPPREAPESAWKSLAVAPSFKGLRNRYPSTLPVDWLEFRDNVVTRAIRLRMTKPIGDNGHPHTKGHD